MIVAVTVCNWHRVNTRPQHHTADIRTPVKYTMYARFMGYSRLISILKIKFG